MIRIFLIRFWPIFLPLALYVLWMWYRRAKARKLGHSVPAFTEGPLGWVLIITLLGFIGGFLYWGMQSEPFTEGHYIAPHMEDGKIVPGRVEP